MEYREFDDIRPAGVVNGRKYNDNTHRYDDADIPAGVKSRFMYNTKRRGYDNAERSASSYA